MTERPIVHSATGTTWSKKVHKYIEKIGNKYIYPVANSAKSAVNTASKNIQYEALKVKNTGNRINTLRNAKAATTQSTEDKKIVAKAQADNRTRAVQSVINKVTSPAKTLSSKISRVKNATTTAKNRAMDAANQRAKSSKSTTNAYAPYGTSKHTYNGTNLSGDIKKIKYKTKYSKKSLNSNSNYRYRASGR